MGVGLGVGLSRERAQPMQRPEVGKWRHSMSPDTQGQGLLGLGGFQENKVIRCRVWVLGSRPRAIETSHFVSLAGLELAAIKAKTALTNTVHSGAKCK